MQHTLPLIATVAEMVFVCHKFPTNTAAVFTMASTSAGYTSWYGTHVHMFTYMYSKSKNDSTVENQK